MDPKLMSLFHPTHLEHKIPKTKITVKNLINAMGHNRPFTQRVVVPNELVKIILFYAFMGKKMITMNIEKEDDSNNTRLAEKIPETRFTVGDLVHAIVNRQAFSQPINVPDDQRFLDSE